MYIGSRIGMARAIGRLTALKVNKVKEAGMYADGGGLYLRVTPLGTKNWVLRYMLDRKPHWMGLGPFPLYGLQEARAKALEARRLRHEGVDPIRSCDVKQPARGTTAKRIRSRFIVASSGELSNRAQGLRDVVERLQNRR